MLPWRTWATRETKCREPPNQGAGKNWTLKRHKQRCLLNRRPVQCILSREEFQLPGQIHVSLSCSNMNRSCITFLISGILGAKRWEVCEMTSWIRAWFFIVLRAFMILRKKIRVNMAYNYQTTHRTIVAWITYLRSSSTALRTSLDSALTSALIGKLRLTRIFFDLKPDQETCN